MRLNDEIYLGQLALSVKADLPEVRGGAQRAEGISERNMTKMTIKVHAQGLAQGTYEADWRKVPGTNEKITFYGKVPFHRRPE